MDEFPRAEIRHQQSMLIQTLHTDNERLYTIFYPGNILAALYKEGSLKIMTQFAYRSAEDVAYHLLNLINIYDCKSAEIMVGGMIDQKSNLINEIRKYFLRIKYAELPHIPSYDEEVKALPEHYFSHLFSASCLCE